MLSDEIKLLKVLNKSKKQITSYELSDATGINRRTIRNEIQLLKKSLAAYDIELISKPSKGYKIIIHDKKKYQELLNSIDDTQSNEKILPTSSKERIEYLTTLLLLSDDYFKTDDIADEVYVSKTSISNDLKIVKDRFSKYNLTIVHKPGLGIKLKGDEVNKRLCMSDFFFHNSVTTFSDLKCKGFDLNELQQILNQIKKIVIDFLFDYKIKIYGIAFENLAAHIAIAIYRIKNNNYIALDEKLYNKFINTEEFKIAEKLVGKIEEQIKIKFPKSEIAYITMHLLGKEVIEKDFIDKGKENIFPENIHELLLNIMDDVYNKLNIDFRDNTRLYISLGMHIVPMLNRLAFNMVMRNPILNEIKVNYPEAYDAAAVAGDTIYRKTGLSLCEDEISYLALHFEYAIEQKLRTIKNVILVCATGRGTSQLISYHIKNKMSDQVNVLGIVDLYNLKSVDFRNVDFIFSTVPISIKVPVPVINIPFFLGDDDIEQIKLKLKTAGDQSLQSLGRYFNKDLFISDYAAENKQDVFRKLDSMVSAYIDDFSGDFIRSVIEREKIVSTEYGNLVAVPHPLKPIRNKTFVAVIILRKPIIWETKKVQLVLLLSLDGREHNLEALYRSLAKFITNERDVLKIINGGNLETLIEVVDTYL